MLPPPVFTVGMVPGFLQTWCLAFRPKRSILISSDQRILFLMVWESLSTVMCLLLPSGHSTIKAWLVECCRDGCPSGRNSYLHRGTLELCQSDHWVFGHLPDQDPSTPISQFGLLYALRCSSKSIQFTTGGLQSSCRNSSRMINGNRMHLSSISSLIAKGLNRVAKGLFWF